MVFQNQACCINQCSFQHKYKRKLAIHHRLTKTGAFNRGLTTGTKNTRTCNTCETGHKVHIVSNHMWSKHRLTTGCSLNQGKKVQELNSAWLQVMSKHMQTKLVVATTVQDKLAYLALKQSHTCTGTTFASSSVKSLFQNYAQGTKQLMLLSVLP